MKKTKKLLACLIAAATMFTMGSTAFAEETVNKVQTPENAGTVTFTKEYNLEGQGRSPKETFTFNIEGESVTDAGDGVTIENYGLPTVGTVTYEVGDAGSANKDKTVSVELPEYKNVGVFTYKISEIADTNTAGVTYDSTPVYMKVTVVNDEVNGGVKIESVTFRKGADEKIANNAPAFTNKYSANSLPVKKVVTGNLGDKNKFFTVRVTLKNNKGKTMSSDISYKVGETTNTIKASDWKNNIATAEIDLKHDQTITFTNLPFGVTYEVTEADYTNDKGGYEVPEYTFTNTNKTVDKTAQNVTITNKKGGKIDTGINLTTLPYILVFAGVIVIAGAAFITRRRKYED